MIFQRDKYLSENLFFNNKNISEVEISFEKFDENILQ